MWYPMDLLRCNISRVTDESNDERGMDLSRHLEDTSNIYSLFAPIDAGIEGACAPPLFTNH